MSFNQLIANPRQPDFLGAFTGGLQANQQIQKGNLGLEQARQSQQRQNRLMELTQTGAPTTQLAQEGFVDQAAKIQQFKSGLTAEKNAEVDRTVKQASALTQGITDPTQFAERIQSSGLFDEEDTQTLLQLGPTGVQSLATIGLKRGAGTKAFSPITLVNAKTGEKRLVSPTVDPTTGAASLAPFDVPEGFEISKETPEEERAADVIAKGQEERLKVSKKGEAGRRQQAINKGLDAADSFANIQRGLDLLDSIETGGIDAVSLKAKQLFGVEGADEAELSNRMGKAVLSQLRETFGAAFTAKEGDQLKDIEAGFGKSTEGNKRLLEQTKRIILRAARRGIRAAKAEGDLDTVADIEESLKFRLESPTAPQATIGRFQVKQK